LDETPELITWAESLERAVIETVNDEGIMTKDLALACGKKERSAWVTTSQFMEAIEKRFKKNLAAEGLEKNT
jgi:isocitrate dehydrogenase